MEESLQRMEVELRLLKKKYYFLQETIENKVDSHAKNILHELEEAFVERVLEKVLVRLNSGVAVVQSEIVEIEDDIGKIQLKNAGEVNGEMNAANVKQEPVDYDDNYEDMFDNNYNDDDQDEVNAIPEIYEENSLVISNYTGSHFVSEAPESVESNDVDEGQFSDTDAERVGDADAERVWDADAERVGDTDSERVWDADAERYGYRSDDDEMAVPVLCQLDYSSESNPIHDSPPILSIEKPIIKNVPREKISVKNAPRKKNSVKNLPRVKASIIKKSPREKNTVENSPREKAIVKSLYKEKTPVPAEDAVMKTGYEGVKRKTTKSTKNENMYKCNDCGLGFRLPSFLKRHMVTHLNTRPYKCSLCYKAYKNRSHLARHVKDSHSTKTNTRKTKKESKEHFFESPAKTETKMKSHLKADFKMTSVKSEQQLEITGTKNNYDCSICGKHFQYPSHLKPHLLGHARKLAKQSMAMQ